LWIQGVFKDQSCRFAVDSGTAGLASGWAWCATVASSCRSAE
jgi:hypothetical protein